MKKLSECFQSIIWTWEFELAVALILAFRSVIVKSVVENYFLVKNLIFLDSMTVCNRMAYVALPTRNSTVLHLANAAARLPRNACSIVQSSRSLKDILPLRPLKVHSSCLSAARILSNLTTTDWRIFSSVEDNVTVEEPAVDATAGGSGGENIPEATAAEETESSEASAKKMQRNSTMKGRAGGKTITVQKDQIVPGAVFTGRVRFVQPYGAFVDIGAFTNGLVHVSELAPGYVKDVSDFVKVGQEVTVTVLEMNEKSKRIALTMRDRESEAAVPSFRSGDELNAGSGTSGDGSGKPTNQGKIAGRGNGGSRSNLKPKLRQSKAKVCVSLGGTCRTTGLGSSLFDVPVRYIVSARAVVVKFEQ